MIKTGMYWIAQLEKAGLSPLRGEPLARYTSFKIGGPADAFLTAKTRAQAAAALAYQGSSKGKTPQPRRK